MTIKEICEDLQKKLKPERYSHTIGVADTAACLAMCYGEDVGRAYTAGILHDCGKYMDGETSLKFCRENGIETTEIERMKPGALLHAKTGAYIAQNLYGEEDEEVIKAIISHTTGDVNLSKDFCTSANPTISSTNFNTSIFLSAISEIHSSNSSFV